MTASFGGLITFLPRLDGRPLGGRPLGDHQFPTKVTKKLAISNRPNIIYLHTLNYSNQAGLQVLPTEAASKCTGDVVCKSTARENKLPI